jgi:hypothetical protein
MQEVVEFRAFRGDRRTSVYRQHVVDRGAYRRLLETASRRRLPLLASLKARGRRELQKDEARRLAVEVSSLQADAELPELDRDLTLIAEVARWCARTPGQAWLSISSEELQR